MEKTEEILRRTVIVKGSTLDELVKELDIRNERNRV